MIHVHGQIFFHCSLRTITREVFDSIAGHSSFEVYEGPRTTVQFHNDKFISPQGLVEFIKKQNGLAKVKDNKLIIKRDWKKNSDKFKGAFAIARDLAEVAASHEKNDATRT